MVLIVRVRLPGGVHIPPLGQRGRGGGVVAAAAAVLGVRKQAAAMRAREAK